MKKLFLYLLFTFINMYLVNGQKIPPSNLIENIKMSDSELKDLLISELKKSSEWEYKDSDYNKIKIIPKSSSFTDGFIYFVWTFQNQHPKYPEWDYLLTNAFQRNPGSGKVFPANEVAKMKWIKRK